MDYQTPDQVHRLLRAAGGASKLAYELGMSRQRVAYWQSKGRLPKLVVMAYGVVLDRIMAKQKLTA